MDQGTRELIDCVYEASLRPEAWREVVAGISEIFEGSPVLLEMRPSREKPLVPRYSAGLREDCLGRYSEYLQKDLSWSEGTLRRLALRFIDLADVFDHIQLEQTDLYRAWMEPQGLACLWPLSRALTDEEDQPVALLSVFRTVGQGAFTLEEREEAERFVPHLRRAASVYRALDAARRVDLALAEVMDRLPTGMLLLNSRRQVVVQNAAAERIVGDADGFHVDGGRPGAEDARENAALQGLIADAMEARPDQALAAHGFQSVSRPSGKRALSLMVAPLRVGSADNASGDVAVALFVSDPERGRISGSKMLEELYSLTQTEADLLQLLSMGVSLEEAAESRGISMNTARSHIKSMFAKTGVSRQGELVRIMLAGLGAIREE
jgi:DNA-binding CsgD family transcriptional regulator/PAS domain-containing protein